MKLHFKMLNLINSEFAWNGDPVECYYTALDNRINTFYKSFTYNGVAYKINDIILLKTVSGKNLAKLLCIYESSANWHVQAKYRGIVKWYTKAADLPKIYTADINYDTDNEVVEDLRNKDTFVSLEDILQKCTLIYSHIDDPVYLVGDMKLNPTNYFSCRYKIKTNTLVPVFDDISTKELIELNAIESTPRGHKIKKKVNDENKQSGVKSASKATKISPFKTVNVVLTPNRAKRNLNESFDNTANSQSETPVLNYSIVENVVDSDKPIRMKLKLSDVRKIDSNVSLEKFKDDLNITTDDLLDSRIKSDDILNVKVCLKEPKVVLDRLNDDHVMQWLNNDNCTNDDKCVKKLLDKDKCVKQDLQKLDDLNVDDIFKLIKNSEDIPESVDRSTETKNPQKEIELRRSSRPKCRKSYTEFISPIKMTSRKQRLQSYDSDVIETNVEDEEVAIINKAVQRTPNKRTRSISISFDDDCKDSTPTKKFTGTPKVNTRPKRTPRKPVKYTDVSEIRNKNVHTPQCNEDEDNNKYTRTRRNARRNQQEEDDDDACIEELNKILFPLKIHKKNEIEDLGVKGLLPNKISPLKIKRSPGKSKQYHIEEDTVNTTPSTRTRTRKLSDDSSVDVTPSTKTRNRKLVLDKKTVNVTPTIQTRTRKLSEDSNSMSISPSTRMRTRKLSEDSESSVPSPRKRANITPSKYKDFYTTPKKGPKEIVVKTPKNTPSAKMKLIREGVITPSMQCRKTAVVSEGTPLNKAREKLHVSYVPDALPCREKEFADILSFVQGKLLDGCGGCMYVSGVPGTGKTATVTEVIRNLQEMVANRDLPDFTFVSINGMRLTEPRQSYVEILKQLTGKTVAWEQAQTMLDTRFTKSSKKNKNQAIVMLVDELDILCTKRQDVVYNLLDWPTKATAQLIVITIANTMDLPERLLMGRVTSRLGLTRLTFQAYTHKQLQEIVMKRLMGTNAFNPDAIQLVARKVASVSGDARRALDICRRAAEIAEAEGPRTLVSMGHVNEALNAMITQPKVRAIKRCSRLEQLILQSIVAEVERTGVDETTFADVYTMLGSVSGIDGFQMVSVTLALAAVSKLGSSRLLLTDQKSNDIHQRLILNVSADDIYYALRRD